MKKLIAVTITLVLLLAVAGCSDQKNDTASDTQQFSTDMEDMDSSKDKTAGDLEIVEWGSSELYTDDDIQNAVDTVIAYFKTEFKGCTLTKISYPGDDSSDLFDQWAKEYEADEAIVLKSSFDVGASGGDGSLNPNTTYDDWQWILVRNNGGMWEVATNGYG